MLVEKNKNLLLLLRTMLKACKYKAVVQFL